MYITLFIDNYSPRATVDHHVETMIKQCLAGFQLCISIKINTYQSIDITFMDTETQ